MLCHTHGFYSPDGSDSAKLIQYLHPVGCQRGALRLYRRTARLFLEAADGLIWEEVSMLKLRMHIGGKEETS